jgi:hypothetical protein
MFTESINARRLLRSTARDRGRKNAHGTYCTSKPKVALQGPSRPSEPTLLAVARHIDGPMPTAATRADVALFVDMGHL